MHEPELPISSTDGLANCKEAFENEALQGPNYQQFKERYEASTVTNIFDEKIFF